MTRATATAGRTDRLAALLERCRDSPGRFNHSVLGGAPFWWRQEQASRLVVDHHTTVLPWGNGLGKSWWAARIVLWWLFTRRNSLIVTTSPSFQNLDTILWKNIRAALAESRYPLEVRQKRNPLQLSLGEEWMVLGVATNRTERMSGQHAGDLMVIADEASGIEPAIWEAIDSLGARKVVLIGNPLSPEGRFKEAYDQAMDEAKDPGIPPTEKTVALRVPSTDSPDFDLEHSPRGFASGGWYRRMCRRYGEDGLWVRTHIKALFPEAAADALIPEAWLDHATTVARAVPFGDPRAGTRRIATDLGEGTGENQSVILVRDDLGILEVLAANNLSEADIASRVAELARKWNVAHADIRYDCLGPIGKRFPNHLRRFNVTGATPYNGNGKPRSHDFTNVRSEAAWNLRNRLDPLWCPDPRSPHRIQPGFLIPAGPWWPSMREDLMALSYDLVESRTRLIRKVDLIAKLGRSPDLGDALLQSFG